MAGRNGGTGACDPRATGSFPLTPRARALVRRTGKRNEAGDGSTAVSKRTARNGWQRCVRRRWRNTGGTKTRLPHGPPARQRCVGDPVWSGETNGGFQVCSTVRGERLSALRRVALSPCNPNGTIASARRRGATSVPTAAELPVVAARGSRGMPALPPNCNRVPVSARSGPASGATRNIGPAVRPATTPSPVPQ